MERSWSEEACAAFDAFPWADERQKRIAHEEAEAVACGSCVEPDDLPLAVRKYAQMGMLSSISGWRWKGETWNELTEAFEKAVLTQALEANNGYIAKAARALGTTQRIVAYKANKYKISTKQKNKRTEG